MVDEGVEALLLMRVGPAVEQVLQQFELHLESMLLTGNCHNFAEMFVHGLCRNILSHIKPVLKLLVVRTHLQYL